MSFFQLPRQLRTYHSYVLTVGFHHHGNPGLAGPTKALIWWASVEEKKLLSELFRVSQPSLQTAPVGLALVLFVSITSPVTGRGNNGLRFSSHSRQLSFGR